RAAQGRGGGEVPRGRLGRDRGSGQRVMSQRAQADRRVSSMCPITAPPAATLVPPGPIASTVPAASRPSTSGYWRGIICAIVPAASALSTGFRAAACAFTSTVSSVTSGTGRSGSRTSAPARGTFHARITQFPDHARFRVGRPRRERRGRGLRTGEHGVDGDRVAHRRHAHLVPDEAEVRPVDLDLAVQPRLAVGTGDHRVEGHRAGPAADGKAAGYPDAPVTRPDVVDGEGDVRVVGDVEEVGRAQVLIPFLVLRVDGPGGDRDGAGHIAGRRYRAVPGDLAEDPLDRGEPPHAPALQPDLGPGCVQRPGPGEVPVLYQRLQG